MDDHSLLRGQVSLLSPQFSASVYPKFPADQWFPSDLAKDYSHVEQWRRLQYSFKLAEQETHIEKSESVSNMHQAQFQHRYILICSAEILNMK